MHKELCRAVARQVVGAECASGMIRTDEMEIIAFIVGLVAVVIYLLCFQQKKRGGIILFNITARALFIIQYVLLSAFEGAVLDVAGIVATFLAQKKNTPLVKKYLKWVIIGTNLFIVVMGALVYENLLSLLPIVAVLLQVNALWLDKEKHIRLVSFWGAPFWLVYNFVSGAYGSCIADVLSMVSIGVAMFRYDFLPLRGKGRADDGAEGADGDTAGAEGADN